MIERGEDLPQLVSSLSPLKAYKAWRLHSPGPVEVHSTTTYILNRDLSFPSGHLLTRIGDSPQLGRANKLIQYSPYKP